MMSRAYNELTMILPVALFGVSGLLLVLLLMVLELLYVLIKKMQHRHIIHSILYSV